MKHRTLVSTLPRATVAAALLATIAACGGGGAETTTVDESADVVAAEPAGEVAPLDESVEAVAVEEPVVVDEPAVMEEDADVAAAAPGEGWEALQGDWASSVATVQAHFGELSEEEVLATGGDRDQLVMMVQEKYNLEPAEAEQQVSDFEAAL